MKKLILSLIISFLFAITAFSQIELTTDDGKKVLLFEDGTWKYADKTIHPYSLDELKCELLCMKHVDEMTGIAYYSTLLSVVASQDGENGIISYIIRSKDKNYLVWRLVALGDGCINDYTEVLILFTDGTRTQFKANNSYNCDGKATVYFLGNWGKRKVLEDLKTKKIKAIRVMTKEGFVQESLDEYQAESIKLSFECISNYNFNVIY